MAKDYVFLDSVNIKKGLFAHIIRSSIPKGTIASIKTPELPKGYYSISAEDIPGKNYISVFSQRMPLLCSGTINYEGEPILVICGPNETEVLKICKNTIIEYETDYSIYSFNNYHKSQIMDQKKFIRGSVDSKFKETEQTIEGEYTTDIQTLPLTYPLGAIAKFKNNIMEIDTATQWPFHVQKSVSDICNIPKKAIQVNIEPYHHTYDEKLIIPSIYAALASILALKSGKQIKIIAEPSEILFYSIKRPKIKIYRKSAINNNGKIIAEDIEISVDTGAYPLFTDELLSQLILGAASIYSITNLRIKAFAIKTSSPPMNVFKGCGIALGTFSAETHFSRISTHQKKNPIELRLEYLPKKNQKLPSGGILKQISQRDLLEKVSYKSDFNRKYSAYEILKNRQKGKLEDNMALRGIGIAIAYTGNGFTRKREQKEAYSMQVKLDQDDKLYISSSSNGSAPENIWKSTASGMLGLDKESIEIVKGDTFILPNSGPSFLSNDLSIMTNLVEKCCNGIKKQRFQKPLPIIVKRSFTSPGLNVWNPEKLKGMPFNTLSWGAAVVEIELDPIFMSPIIRGIWTIFDIGKIYNMKAALTSAESGIYEALNWTAGSRELFHRPISSYNLDEIEKIKLPDINIDFISDSKRSSGGISQLPDAIIPSAYVQAVSQASGIYFDTIPITPEVILKYLERT